MGPTSFLARPLLETATLPAPLAADDERGKKRPSIRLVTQGLAEISPMRRDGDQDQASVFTDDK
jgi:hypothetical protein